MGDIRVAINGFGRIGRSVVRAAKKMNADINFVAINDLVEPDKLATVLKYDSVHVIYPGEIETIDKNVLKVFDVRNSVNLKSSYGGTSIKNIKKMISTLKKEFK